MKNWFLISYDIHDPKRLRSVAKKLEGYGHRLQYSVFRCRLSQRALERLRWELVSLLEKEDDLLIVGLCDRCVERIRNRPGTAGWADETERTVIV